MTLTFASPHALWLLLVLPLLWLATWFGRTNYSRHQRVWQLVVRTVSVAALALALARPTASWGTPSTAVVYLVDVSHSIASAGVKAAADRIDALNREAAPSRSRIVVFGRDVAVLPDTATLRAIAEATGGAGTGPVDRNGSDLAQALEAARAEFPAGHLPHIVLFSDGLTTSADVMPEIARLAADGVRVSTEALAVRDLGDMWIDSLEAPHRVTTGVPTPVRVTIGSQRSGNATVELRDGDRTLGSSRHAIEPGQTLLTQEVVFAAPGSRRLEVRLAVADDPLAVNNTLAIEAKVSPPTRVLYVEGTPESARYLSNALTGAGLAVSITDPRGLAAAANDLDPWDLVVLSDLARASIPDEVMNALGRWVEHDGGGVFFAGGESVFGEATEGQPGSPPGYRHTELERLMPVTFERKDEPEVALVIVLDKSWSMEGAVMELCKAAAIAAVDVMTPKQLIGVVVFDNEFKWEVPIRAIGEDRRPIRDAIAGVQASGATRIFPALEQAYFALEKVSARSKHVILLTDGRSYEAEYETLVRKMVGARITVSSVGVGPAVDRDLLTKIATWGMGRSYMVSDPRNVQQIFVREAQDAAAPAFDEAVNIRPVIKTRAFLETVDFDDVPPLRGRSGMALKDEATEILATDDGSPILAFWAVGAGRTAAFASDVKDRWANQWLTWRGYAPFFAATARALARQRVPRLDLSVDTTDVQLGRRRVAARLEIRDAHGAYRNLLEPTLKVQTSGAANGEVAMRQVAPGRYETTVSAAADEALTFSAAVSGEPDVTERVILPDPHAEYRLRPADTALLGGIAAATGGVHQPTPRDIATTATNIRLPQRELWPPLVALALFLWFADILLRRLRFRH